MGDYLGFISDKNHIVGLNLNSKELIGLPDSICNLTQLRVLYLRWNKLETLPENIGNLTSLRELYLASNQILSLPESIRQLKKLEVLIVRNNPLSEDDLTKLKNLLPDTDIL